MGIFIFLIILFQACIGILLYRSLYRSHKLFSDRFGMIIAMVSSGVLSFSLALNIFFLFPNSLTVHSIFSALIGAIIGILFGSLVKFQSLLTGFFHGVIGGIMGTMLAAVTKNPELCSLPSLYANNIEQNIFVFSLFSCLLTLSAFGMLLFSYRV